MSHVSYLGVCIVGTGRVHYKGTLDHAGAPGTTVRTPLLVALVAVTGGCRLSPPPSAGGAAIVGRARVAMGSELRLTAAGVDEATAVAAFDAVFGEVDRLESLMSVWREGSDIQRLNAAAGVEPVVVNPEVREVLEVARQVS